MFLFIPSRMKDFSWETWPYPVGSMAPQKFLKYTLSFKGFPHMGFQKGIGPPAESDLPQPWWENTLAKPS